MFYLIVRMKAIPDKCMELCQTLASMIPVIREQEGCRACRFCRSVYDQNEICVLAEWDTRERAAAHLDSEIFKALLGTTALLKRPSEVSLYDVSYFPQGIWKDPPGGDEVQEHKTA